MAELPQPTGQMLTGRILDSLPADAPQIILIDGFSGAGKSTLADLLVAAWTVRGGVRPRLVRLEHIYPGWDGLDAASDQLLHGILQPLADGRAGTWRRWDWGADAAAESHSVDAGRLVVEGVGALTSRSRRLAGLGVWIDLDAQTRKTRALERDGAVYRQHWERWAAQEKRFAARERPRDSADLCIDGLAVDRTPR